MAGALQAIEQARFRQQQRTRADGRNNRATVVHSPQPFDLSRISAARRRIDRCVQVADDDNIDTLDGSDADMRLNQHIAEAAERVITARDDLYIEQAVFGLTGRHVGVDCSDGQQYVIQAVEHRGRRLRRCQKGNRRSCSIGHVSSPLAEHCHIRPVLVQSRSYPSRAAGLTWKMEPHPRRE